MPSEPNEPRAKKSIETPPEGGPPDKQTHKAPIKKKRKPARPAGSAVIRQKQAVQREKRHRTRREAPGKTPTPNPALDNMARAAGRTGLGSAVGQVLYLLGFYAECKFVQVWRVLRVAFGLLGQLFAWAFGGVGRSILRFAKSIFRDVAAPFVRFVRGLRNVRRVLAEEREKGNADAQKKALAYFGSGVRSYLYLVANLVKFLLPIGAAFVFGITVYSILNLEYNLQIVVNGEVVGVVSDEQAFEDARIMMRQRIRVAEGKGAESLVIQPRYSLVGSAELTTKETMANNLVVSLAAGDDDAPVDATGIYVDDTLYVTDDAEAVDEFLQQLKAQYTTDDRQADFVQEVSYDLEADDLFFESSVRPAEEVIEQLSSVVEEEQVHVATGYETLSEIAHNYNLTTDVLEAYNPNMSYGEWEWEQDPDAEPDGGQTEPEATQEGEDEDAGDEEAIEGDSPYGDYIPAPGTQLVVKPEQRTLQVKTVYIREVDEPRPYETQIEESYDMVVGQTKVEQEGEEGILRMRYEVTVIDGIETVLPLEGYEPEWIKQPVPRIELHGAYVYNYTTGTSNATGSAAFIFPLENYTRLGRGMSLPGHRGWDINANANEPIYAIAGGTVIEAGWHYSWGNTVMVDHGNGYTSRYAHCNSLNVAVGDVISQGYCVGFVGSTGYSTGNHLHLEIMIDGNLVDPQSVVAP